MRKWNIGIAGKLKPLNYYGYNTKKEALSIVDRWNKWNKMQVVLLKYDDNTKKYIEVKEQ